MISNNDIKKTSTEELEATQRLLLSAQSITPENCPNVKLLKLVSKELEKRKPMKLFLLLE